MAKTVAVVLWGDVFQDFLDHLGVSLEQFESTFTGSWVFGYIRALEAAGVRSVLYCVSSQVKHPVRFTHAPSGVPVRILPTPAVHGRLVKWIQGIKPVADQLGSVRATVCSFIEQATRYVDTPLSSFWRELRRDHCDAIICQQYEYQRFDACVFLGRLMRIPVFATYQGGDDERGSSDLERWIRPLSLRACSGLIAASYDEGLRLRARYGVPPEKIARIFNPIDLAFWNPMPRDEARARIGIPAEAGVVVWHGRVEPWKGLDLLLHAWERVCQERADRDVRLLIVGTGSDADGLRHRIASMQLRGVHWIDRFVHDRDEIRCYLSAADVYAFPSREEGFAVSPLEAMACGLPVVATDVQGIPDLLQEGEASGGIIVPCNEPSALAQTLGRLLDDEPRRRLLGQRARRRVEACFKTEMVGRQLQAFLASQSATCARQTLTSQDSECAEGALVEPLALRAIWPNHAQARTSFKMRHDGQSVLSIAAEHANRGTLVVLGGRRLTTAYNSPRYLTALVPPVLLRRPARHRVFLTDGERRSNELELVVTDQAPSAAAPLQSELGPEIFRASLDFFICPPEMVAGATYSLEMNVRNEAPSIWPVSGLGVPAVRLTYHWLRATGEVHDYGGLQTELPHTLGPGETTRVTASVQAPTAEGLYQLQWDLLIEQVAWFSTQGWQGPTCHVRVISPASSGLTAAPAN